MGDPVKEDTQPGTSPDTDTVTVGSINPDMNDAQMKEAIVKAYSGMSDDLVTEFAINPDINPKDLPGFKAFLADNLFIDTNDGAYQSRFENLRNQVIEEMAPKLFPATRAEFIPYVHQNASPDQQTATNPATGADPVILFNGNFVYSSTDLQLMAPGITFNFQRNYSQLSKYNGPLGYKWDHCYNLWIRQADDPNLLHCSDGKLGEALYKRHAIHDYWIPPDGHSGIIREQAGSYELQRPDGSKAIYQQHPTLSPFIHNIKRIEDRFGNYLHFYYTEGLLARVEINHPHRTVSFSYDSQNRIISLRDFSGRSWRYFYDDLDDLVAVTTPGSTEHPRGLTTRYEYSSAEYYNPSAQHNLTEIIDAEGLIYLENEYGTVPNLVSYNRVIRQRQAGGDLHFEYADVTEAFEYDYEDHERPTHQTIVTEMDGRQVRYLFNRSGMMLFREEYARLNGLPKLILTHYRYNKDGNLIGVISPLGIIQQSLYGRDQFERKFMQDPDYRAEEDVNLTPQNRQGFNVILAQVRRSGYYSVASLDRSGGIWAADIFPDIYDTNDNDIIQKFSYEPEFFQVNTVSDPRFTFHTDPDQPEPAVYQQYLTRYHYAAASGFQHFHLAAVELPRPKLPDGTSGDPVQIQFADYDTKGNPKKVIAPNGLITNNEYFSPADGLLEGFLKATEVDPGGLAARAAVDRDMLGRIIRTYSARHFDNPGGRHYTSAEYNALNQLIKTISPGPSSVITRHFYNRTGKVKLTQTELKDEANNPTGIFETANKYDEVFNLLSQVSGNEALNEIKRTKFIYDRAGRPCISILPGDHKMKLLYNERGFPAQVISDYGAVHSAAKKYYDADGRVIRIVDPLGNSTRYAYNAFGQPVDTEDAKGNRHIKHFDKAGNLLVELFFEKKVDGNYLLLSRKESRYDELGRKIGIGLNKFETGPTIAGGQLFNSFIETGPGELLGSSYYFNSIGNLVKIIDQSGKLYESTFDKAGRLLTKTDPFGNSIQFSYDKENNITRTDRKEVTRDQVTGAVINTRYFAEQFVYDELNRLIEKTDQLGSKSSYAYDSRNNMVKTIDVMGNECLCSFDLFNRVLKRTEFLHHYIAGETPEPVSILYHYNAADQVDRQTDALGRITSIEYDTSGRTLSTILPDGSKDSFLYDRAGNISSYTDRNGLQKHFIYDPLQQTIQVDIDTSTLRDGIPVGGALQYKTLYDGLRRVIRMENEHVATELMYNSLGWNIEERNIFQPINGIQFPAAYTLQRSFNNNGAQTGLIYPSGREIIYDRDILERLVAIRQVNPGTEYPGANNTPDSYTIANFEYEGLQRKKITRNNNTSTEFHYDFGARLTEINHFRNQSGFLRLQYLYDAAGNMRQQSAVAQDYTNTQTYQYDSISRLIAVQETPVAHFIDPGIIAPAATLIPDIIPNRQQQLDAMLLVTPPQDKRKYNYDLTGNRSSVVTMNGANQYEVNQLDQYEKINTTEYAHDQNGNIVTAGMVNYIYNHQDQPVSVKTAIAGEEVLYLYDAFGRRCAELIDGEVRTLHYDGYNQLEMYKNAGIYSSTVYDQGADNLLVSSSAQSEHYLYPDLNKSVRYVLGPVARQQYYQYDEFGNTVDSLSIDDENPFRYGGKRILPHTGHYDFVFRVYSPAAGRFIQRDPKGTIDGTNLYVYVKNNPLTNTDLLGMESRPETAGNSALTAFRAANTPVDINGNPLKGPYNLWSHDVPGGGLDKAKAASGWIMGQTPEHQIAEAAQLAHPNNATNNIPPKDWDDIWGKSSRSIARRAVISGKPVRSFGLDTHPNPTGTMQYQHEIPTVGRWGIFTGFTMKFGGLLNMWSASQVDNPWVKAIGMFGGAAEVIGGTSYLAGAATMNTAAMSFGSGISRFIGGPTTILLSGYAFYHDIKNGNYLDAVGSGSGVLTGVALVAGWTTGAVVFGSFGAGWSFGRWIDKKTGWSTALANRADRNREIYKDMGLGDTASTILGAPATIPVISEVGEGIGWAAFKLYEADQYVSGKMSEAYDSITDAVGYELCVPFYNCDD